MWPHSETIKLSNQLCAGCLSDLSKLEACYNWILKNITYDTYLAQTVESWWLPVPDKVLAARKSICWGYASLLAGLMRCQDIPCSIEVGNVFPGPEVQGRGVYHAYNKVWIREPSGHITPEIKVLSLRWFRLDPTFHATSNNGTMVAEITAEDTRYQTQYRG